MIANAASWASRRILLAAARSRTIKTFAVTAPATRKVVARFVAGERVADVVRVAGELAGLGLLTTIDHVGEDTLDRRQASATGDAYVALLSALSEAGLSRGAEVSVKLSAVGQALPGDGQRIALENARRICAAALAAGTTVTLDMEDHTTTDSTLGVLRDLRVDFPQTAVALQAYLLRTEGDCRDLDHAGSRVRLCKGAYREPSSIAHQSKDDVRAAYRRCLQILMEGRGYPMVASHDPQIIEAAGALAAGAGRKQGDYEFQMLYGVRPEEQVRLAASGHKVRVYVPYGADWYGYLVRRLAEKPSNLALVLRALTSRS